MPSSRRRSIERHARAWVKQARARHVRERHSHEPALEQARVRHDHAGLVDDLVTVEQQIDVEGPRRLALAGTPHPPELAFDGQAEVEQAEVGG